MSTISFTCARPPAPLQMGVAAGIERLRDGYYVSLCEQFRAKRDVLCQTLAAIGLTPMVPQGSYYVLADVSRLPGDRSKAKAMFLLERTGVPSVPGAAFHLSDAGRGLVRFCFAKPDAELEDACRRLRRL